MSENFFLQPDEFYQRDINPLAHYVDQSSFYASKMLGEPIEIVREKIINKIKTNGFKTAHDPVVRYFERENYSDRHATQMRLSQYIASISKENLVMAPTMTCYVPTTEKESLLVEFTDNNTKLRSFHKKNASKAKAEGNTVLHIFEDNLQAAMKIYNNSTSGAFNSGGSVINNPTAHSSLTSTTRTMTSLGNASNEKIIAGNRHYKDPDVTLNNIILLAKNVNQEDMGNFLERYSIYRPTVQDVMDCITYSSDLYWKDKAGIRDIREFVEKLNDTERAAVVYTADLYHLRKHNDQFVKTFLTRLSRKVKDRKYEDPIKQIYSTDELIVNYVHHICIKEVRGIGKDYGKISEEARNIVAGTCENIQETLRDYQDFIRTIFLTKTMPCTVGHIKDMIRRSVVLSDTDSTMFSVDDWVKWYFGEVIFTDEAFAVAGSVMFIATQSIAHNLALFSANMNVERKKLYNAAMKPEFVFPVFAQTSVAKHYYTTVMIKEGSVYSENEMEIKGVQLKSSASPKEIIDDAQALMKRILTDIQAGKKISLLEVLKHVSDAERKITASLIKGEAKFYRIDKIKNPEAYTLPPDRSPYQHHLLWEEIFASKYGNIEAPVYPTIAIPTTLTNKTQTLQWLENMKDQAIAEKFKIHLARKNKVAIGTFYLSIPYVEVNGIPEEIASIIDTDRIILTNTGAYRHILESLGFFPKAGWTLMKQGY